MALTESNMLSIGTIAPAFCLSDTISGGDLALVDIAGSTGTLIVFSCNHCPYVIHINQELVKIGHLCKSLDIGMAVISSNDVENYNEDSPDKMSIVAKVLQYPFPYLYDESQEVAKAYDAACTPDFYLFDSKLRLYYRGRLDGSRPGNGVPLDGADLRSAISQMLAGDAPPEKQYPSAGCNIKWKK